MSKTGRSHLTLDDCSMNMSNENYEVQRSRRSARLSSKKHDKSKDMSINNEIVDIKKQVKILRKPIQNAFGYDVKEVDAFYLQDLFTELPKLKDIWTRIGFTNNIQDNRLDAFYEKMNVNIEV